MITTKEGIVKKRGEKVWEIGYCITNKCYRPTLSKVYGGGVGVANPDRCWASYDNCLKECDVENKKKISEKRKDICNKLLKEELIIK